MSGTYNLTRIATQVRRDIVRQVSNVSSGHPGGSMSSTDFITALFFDVMNHTPKDWDRSGKKKDMFFLSAGHLSPLFYSVLARSGYFDLSELNTFRHLGSRLQGHPSVGLPGVYAASGSLGQGLSVACGAALGKKAANEKDTYVYVLLGDGECEEGQVWEAAMFAAHRKVDNLIALIDWNNQQIDGTVEAVMGLTDLDKKWQAFGWETLVVDGHNMEKILQGYAEAHQLSRKGKPVVILMKTEMGHGVDFMTGTNEYHGKAPNKEQTEIALAQLEETLGDF